MSADRVRELEDRLSHEVEQPKTSRATEAPGFSGEEWSKKLQEEQEKRTGASRSRFAGKEADSD